MKKNTSYITKIAILSAMAVILMLFEFPLPFIAPPFYELDFSEVPVLLGAFALGPIAGIIIEAIKIIFNLLLNGSITGGIGEIANFVVGLLYILPAAIIYRKTKTKKGAVSGLICGSILMVIISCFVNAYIMLPAYGKVFGWNISKFVEMGAQIWPSTDSLLEFVIYCVAPFNLIKVVIVSIITFFTYKHISTLLKK
jgi:riboflavin transporter FmnP